MNLVQSASEPAAASRFTVRCMGSLIVATFLPGFWPGQRSLEEGLAPPSSPPSQVSQPMLHPTENQRHVCADSQAEVPLVQPHGGLPPGCHL